MWLHQVSTWRQDFKCFSSADMAKIEAAYSAGQSDVQLDDSSPPSSTRVLRFKISSFPFIERRVSFHDLKLLIETSNSSLTVRRGLVTRDYVQPSFQTATTLFFDLDPAQGLPLKYAHHPLRVRRTQITLSGGEIWLFAVPPAMSTSGRRLRHVTMVYRKDQQHSNKKTELDWDEHGAYLQCRARLLGPLFISYCRFINPPPGTEEWVDWIDPYGKPSYRKYAELRAPDRPEHDDLYDWQLTTVRLSLSILFLHFLVAARIDQSTCSLSSVSANSTWMAWPTCISSAWSSSPLPAPSRRLTRRRSSLPAPPSSTSMLVRIFSLFISPHYPQEFCGIHMAADTFAWTWLIRSRFRLSASTLMLFTSLHWGAAHLRTLSLHLQLASSRQTVRSIFAANLLSHLVNRCPPDPASSRQAPYRLRVLHRRHGLRFWPPT